MPYRPPMPARKDVSAGKIAIILIVAFFLVIVAPTVLYLIVVNLGPDYDEPRITINMAMPEPIQRQIGGTSHWDVTSRVNMVSPSGTKLLWSEVRIIVKSSMGALLIPATLPSPDAPASYDDASDGTVDVEAWFIDVDGDGNLEAGDTLKLTGIGASYEGAVVEMVKAGARIASLTLPTDFPP